MSANVNTKIQNRIDQASKLGSLSAFFFIEAAIFTVIVAYSGVSVAWFGSDVFNLALLPLIYVLLSSASSFILSSFEFKARSEEEEKELLQKRKESSALEVGEDVMFVARRSLGVFKKYTPYVISVLKVLSAIAFLYIYYSHVQFRVEAPLPAVHAQAAFVSFLLSLACLFSGVFAIGQSRDMEFRWLRASGSWLIMSSVIFAFASISILLIKAGYPEWDERARNIFFVVLALIGLELFLNFVMEFYRPRGGMEERPVFESRFLALFTEPGGLMRNIAETLDYQFGFKISGTWLYRIFETSLIPLFMLWLASLWLMTCFVQIYPNELGIRESFGVMEKGEPLLAGIHLKLPYPYGRIIRIPADDVQEIFVGMSEEGKIKVKDKDDKESDAILWTVSHYGKEVNFLVASEKAVSENEVPVSYISSVFNIQYKIGRKGLLEYYYGNDDVRKTIKAI
ncbi:MAG TPA: hypothetical protein PK821_00965, partial [Victivallales bacterium]|nr:hypothetical protein [Victivallales bacterium]